MRRAAALVLALLAGACAAPGGPPSTDVLGRLPERIGPFARNGTPQRDPAASTVEGGFLRYQAPFGIATVFLYREAGAPVPDGPESEASQRQLLAATQQLLFVGVAGQAPVSYQARPGFGVRPAQGPAWRCTETWRSGDNAPSVAEYACVTGVLERFLKLRVTLRGTPEAADQARRLVAGFAVAVGGGLTTQSTGGAKPAPAAPAEDDALPDPG